MAITASAGSVSAQVEARRPSWADMGTHYPGSDIKTQELYDNKIGGRFKGLYDHPAYQNTCAVRMSYGLNRSGLKLGKAPSSGGSVQGGDGHTYWIRVSDLKPFLVNRFKGADEQLKLTPIPSSLIGDVEAMRTQYRERKRIAEDWLANKLGSRKGIVVFDVTGWGDATGHFTLWDGSKLVYAPAHDDATSNTYYFWLTALNDDGAGGQYLVQVVSVKFWELK